MSMIKTVSRLTLCITILPQLGWAQEENADDLGFPVSQIEWTHVFGSRGQEDPVVYTLMSQGFLGMPFMSKPVFCEDLDEHIGNWLRAHGTARAIPVQSIPLDPDVSFTYVWVTADDESLNVDLVRRGCCHATNMQVNIGSGELLIPRANYQSLEKELLEAERIAIKQKNGLWARKDYRGKSSWTTAEHLEREGNTLDAIEAYKASLGHMYDDAIVWIRIGNCYDKLKQHEQAIEAFDTAIRVALDDSVSRFALVAKAEIVGRIHGPEKAAAMFGDVVERCAEKLDPCQDLSVAHMSGGNTSSAITVLEQGIRAFIAHNKLRFDDLQFTLEVDRSDFQDSYWQNVNSIVSALTSLANYYVSIPDYDKAFKYASMGLSVSQAIKEHAKHVHDAVVAKAGNFNSRLTRAQVFIHRESFENAKHELDQAKILVDVGQIQGTHIRTTLDHAYAQLRSSFPDRQIDIPARHDRRREFARPPTAEVLAKTSEGDLVVMAAGDEPAVSYAALEELVARHLRGNVSAAGNARLITDGLELQQDPTKRWRAQYGIFIEHAWKHDMLPVDRITQYVKHTALPQALNASYADYDLDPEHGVRLVVGFDLETRIGASYVTRNDVAPRDYLRATVRLLDVSVDEKPVSVFGRSPDKPVVWTTKLSGGTSGRFFKVKNSRDLAPGSHTVTVRGIVEFRSGITKPYIAEEKLLVIVPLATNEFSLSTEFNVNAP